MVRVLHINLNFRAPVPLFLSIGIHYLYPESNHTIAPQSFRMCISGCCWLDHEGAARATRELPREVELHVRRLEHDDVELAAICADERGEHLTAELESCSIATAMSRRDHSRPVRVTEADG